MDISNAGAKIKTWIFRFRYAILVVLVGLVLLNIPVKKKIQGNITSTEPIVAQKETISTAEQLTDILQHIHGVGRVKVLLTVSCSEKKEYQQDQQQTTSDGNNDIRLETVIIRDADDNEMALITQIISPEYLGAIVVCEGADDANVKLAVLEAVSKATGLRSDSISVLKMK